MSTQSMILNDFVLKQSIMDISSSLTGVNSSTLTLEIDKGKLDLYAFTKMETLLEEYCSLVVDFKTEFNGVLVSINNTVSLFKEMDNEIASIIENDSSSITKSTI